MDTALLSVLLCLAIGSSVPACRSPSSARAESNPAVNGAFTVGWAEENGDAIDCEAAGATTVRVVSDDVQRGGTSQDLFRCADGVGVSGALRGGAYRLRIDLLDCGTHARCGAPRIVDREVVSKAIEIEQNGEVLDVGEVLFHLPTKSD